MSLRPHVRYEAHPLRHPVPELLSYIQSLTVRILPGQQTCVHKGHVCGQIPAWPGQARIFAVDTLDCAAELRLFRNYLNTGYHIAGTDHVAGLYVDFGYDARYLRLDFNLIARLNLSGQHSSTAYVAC